MKLSVSWAVALCLGVAFVMVPAARGEDTATPKKAAVAFAKAVEAGDMKAAKELSTGTEKEYALVKIMSDMIVGMKKLDAASVKKFGDEGKLPKEMNMSISDEFAGASEKIDGNKAILVVKGKEDDKFPPTLKKDGDNWKVDLSNLTADPEAEGIAKIGGPMTKALGTVTKNIEDGKYKSLAEAMADLQALMGAALGGDK